MDKWAELRKTVKEYRDKFDNRLREHFEFSTYEQMTKSKSLFAKKVLKIMDELDAEERHQESVPQMRRLIRQITNVCFHYGFWGETGDGLYYYNILRKYQREYLEARDNNLGENTPFVIENYCSKCGAYFRQEIRFEGTSAVAVETTCEDCRGNPTNE